MENAEYWLIKDAVDQILPANVNQTRKKLLDRVRYAIEHQQLSLTDKRVHRSEFLEWADRRGLNIPPELRPFIRNIEQLHLECSHTDSWVWFDAAGGFVHPTSLEQAIVLLHEFDKQNMQLQIELQKARVKIAKLQRENDALRQTAGELQKDRESRRTGGLEATKAKRARHEPAIQRVGALRDKGYTKQEAVAEVVKEIEAADRSERYRDRRRSILRILKDTTR